MGAVPVGRRPSVSSGGIVRLAALVLVGALSIVVIGVPATLGLAGAALIARATGRLVPSARGPAAWAVGVLGTSLVLLAGSAAAALVAPGTQPVAFSAVLLAAPGVLGGAGLVIAARRGRARAPWEPSAWLPLVVVGVALGVAGLVQLSGPLHGVAWATSGDARNQVLLTRQVLHDGGLTVPALTRYPVGVNAIVAAVSALGPRTGTPAALLLGDLHAMASVYVLAGVAVAVLLAAAVLETVEVGRRRSAGVIALALAAATLAASPALLGLALTGGFLSAYGALPWALGAVVIALHAVREPRGRVAALLVLTAATPLTFIGWTLLAVVPAAAQVVVTVVVLGGRDRARLGPQARSRLWARLAAAVSLGALVLLATLVLVNRIRLASQLVATGTTPSVTRFALPSLALLAALMERVARDRAGRGQALVAGGVLVSGGVLVLALAHLAGGPPLATYYGQKTNWLVAASMAWLPFGLVARYVAGLPADRARRWPAIASHAVIGAVLAALIGSATSVGEPLGPALKGWHQPSARVLADIMAMPADVGPFVLWGWSSPGDDQLGNFWSVVIWAGTPSGGLERLQGVSGGPAGWAYSATTDQALCTLAEAVPALTVLSHSDDLATRMHETCPDATIDVVDSP